MAARLKGQGGTDLELKFSLGRSLFALPERIVPYRGDAPVTASREQGLGIPKCQAGGGMECSG